MPEASYRMKLLLGFVSLAAILSMLVPGSVSGQGDFRIFVTDYDAIHELDLKATEGQNGQVNQVSGFAIKANSVVQINQNENLQVFTSTNEPIRIEKVKVTDQSGQLIELTKSGNQWLLQGFDDGVYLLDVIVNMPSGEKGAFETVLVIKAPNTQNADPNQVITQVVKTDTKLVFRDQKPKPKPNICYFDPNNKACEPVNGKCRPGFGFNDDDRCIPIGECPSGYGRLDDDETGTCYPKKDIKRCPDGYIVHVREQCPPSEPIVCPAGQQLSSDGLSCAPPCDGSYQDCIYNGHLCKAGSTEHACELPLEEGEEEAGLSCQPEDDFCEPGCESPSMDCVDDVNKGDDGEDSTNEENEEETSNCGGEPCTDTEKEDSTLDDEEESSGDEESASDEGADTGGDGMFG
jgi:hypothetical protein